MTQIIGTAYLIYGDDGQAIQIMTGEEDSVNEYCFEKGYTFAPFPLIVEFNENDLPY